MPRFPNKVLNNESTTAGNAFAIQMEYESAHRHAEEILEYKIPLDQFDDMQADLEVECSRHAKSDDEHIQYLRKMNTETRKRIDDYLKANPQIIP